MPALKYAAYMAADPYFSLVRRALGDLVDGEHFFDIVTDDTIYEVLYDLGWPRVIRGRTGLMDAFRGYVGIIRLQSADNLFTQQTRAASLSSSMKSMGLCWRQEENTAIDFVRSSISRIGRSRVGEITWTHTQRGVHCRRLLAED